MFRTPGATPANPTLTELAAAYREGRTTPGEATEAYLARIEPGPVFRTLTAERARAQARRAERAFEAGVDLGPLQGIPLAVKDLLDMEGEVSAAGSAALLAAGRVAETDAPLIARLDEAGAVFLGRTQMTELAFSGLGLNPHFGTPGCVADPARVPGGSSSGSSVAVASGMACAALGSDTGGSVRIPAAFQGLVGLKTTDRDLPTEGVVPLSTTLDTVGPIARTPEDAWHLWRAMKAWGPEPPPAAPGALTLWAPPTVLQEGLDPEVARAFDAATASLEAAGHTVIRDELPALRELHELYGRYGSFAAYEALAMYEDLLEQEGVRVDPRVSSRILAVRGRPATDYLRLGYARTRLARTFWDEARRADAVIAPTVQVQPPYRAPLERSDEAYVRANAAVLRNTTVFNLASGPAVQVPIGRCEAGLPVGGMVAAPPGREAQVLAVATRWQEALADG
ncbi:MAG: amidase family protein [Trueperaceae bacterium]|nr:amidase family protein [Trueperaceae bacterium]